MIVGALCVLIGVAGSLLPVLPGTPVSYVGLLLLLLIDGCSFSAQFLLIMLLLVVLQQVLNYVIPIWGVKKYGPSPMPSCYPRINQRNMLLPVISINSDANSLWVNMKKQKHITYCL